MCPEVDSAPESEYQGFLLGLRRPVLKADDLISLVVPKRQENPGP